MLSTQKPPWKIVSHMQTCTCSTKCAQLPAACTTYGFDYDRCCIDVRFNLALLIMVSAEDFAKMVEFVTTVTTTLQASDPDCKVRIWFMHLS